MEGLPTVRSCVLEEVYSWDESDLSSPQFPGLWLVTLWDPELFGNRVDFSFAEFVRDGRLVLELNGNYETGDVEVRNVVPLCQYDRKLVELFERSDGILSSDEDVKITYPKKITTWFADNGVLKEEIHLYCQTGKNQQSDTTRRRVIYTKLDPFVGGQCQGIPVPP